MAERRDYLQKLVPLGKILSLIWPLDYPRAKLITLHISKEQKAVVGGKLVEKKIHKNRSYVKT